MAELFKEIKVKMDPTPIRKQILVVKTPMFMQQSELEDLRRNIEEQMKTGLVILSGAVDAFTIDQDTLAAMTREDDTVLIPSDCIGRRPKWHT